MLENAHKRKKTNLLRGVEGKEKITEQKTGRNKDQGQRKLRKIMGWIEEYSKNGNFDRRFSHLVTFSDKEEKYFYS